jgi:hypothetical protein
LFEFHGFLKPLSGGSSNTLDHQEGEKLKHALLIFSLLGLKVLLTKLTDVLVVREIDLGDTKLHQIHRYNDTNISVVMTQSGVGISLHLNLLSLFILKNLTVVLFRDSAELFEHLDLLFGAQNGWELPVFDILTFFAGVRVFGFVV